MKSVVKIEIVIPESRRPEIDLPQDVPTGPAEILVPVRSQTASPARTPPIGMDVGKGQIAEDFDAPLSEDLLKLFEGRS